MKVLDTYGRTGPTSLVLKMTADSNVMAYGAFLIHLPDQQDVAQWDSGVLESNAGGQATLNQPTGYAIVVVPIVSATQATLHATLTLNGVKVFDQDVTIPAKEAFGWVVTIN